MSATTAPYIVVTLVTVVTGGIAGEDCGLLPSFGSLRGIFWDHESCQVHSNSGLSALCLKCVEPSAIGTYLPHVGQPRATATACNVWESLGQTCQQLKRGLLMPSDGVFVRLFMALGSIGSPSERI